MKRFFSIFILSLSACIAAPAWAGGPGHHGGGHYHGGYRHHGGGWNSHWVGPVLGAAIVGSAIYAASTPAYAAPVQTVTVYPPVVTMAPPAPRVAYVCGPSQQFYPTVPTCTVPWQLVSY